MADAPEQSRSDRPPRGERGDVANEVTVARAGVNAVNAVNAGERGERRPREQVPQAVSEAAVIEGQPDAAEVLEQGAQPQGTDGNGQDEGRRDARRSRDRYGRDRRERNGREEAAPADADADAVAATQPSPETGEEPAGDAAERRPRYATGFVADEPARAAADAAVAAAPASRGEQPPAPAGLPKVQSFELPVDELAQIASGSGLQWVNSDADKIAAVQAAIAAEPKPIRVPRERPPAVVIDEGPLVLVETRRDLRNLPLPFEQQQPGQPPAP